MLTAPAVARAVGIFYGFCALVLVYVLASVQIAIVLSASDIRTRHIIGYTVTAVLLLLIALYVALTYGFLRFRRWALRLGILSSVAFVVLGILALLDMFGRVPAVIDIVFHGLFVVVPACLLGVCLAPSVRRVMTR